LAFRIRATFALVDSLFIFLQKPENFDFQRTDLKGVEFDIFNSLLQLVEPFPDSELTDLIFKLENSLILL
jgi:hypothetical protein